MQYKSWWHCSTNVVVGCAIGCSKCDWANRRQYELLVNPLQEVTPIVSDYPPDNSDLVFAFSNEEGKLLVWESLHWAPKVTFTHPPNALVTTLIGFKACLHKTNWSSGHMGASCLASHLLSNSAWWATEAVLEPLFQPLLSLPHQVCGLTLCM